MCRTNEASRGLLFLIDVKDLKMQCLSYGKPGDLALLCCIVEWS